MRINNRTSTISGFYALAGLLFSSLPVNAESSRSFPSNYSIYGVNLRDHTVTTSANGQGLFVTCDTGEVAIGAFCEEKASGISEPNALLTGGVATTRSIACRWKNPGVYRAVASCLAIDALRGDPERGLYAINTPLK